MRRMRAAEIGPRLAHLVLALVALDLALIAAHLTLGLTPTGASRPTSAWNLGMEWGAAEGVEHAKALSCALLMLWLARRTRQPVFGFFAFLYAATFVDNAFQLHETLGDLERRFGLEDDVAQLLVFLCFGTAMLASSAVVLRRTDAAHLPAAALLLALFALLAFFSVALDALHVPTVIEDGGELVTLSLHLAAAGLLAAREWRDPAGESYRRAVPAPASRPFA